MGFYAKHILPHLIDVTMRNKEAARLRAIWIPQARGDVLEVGIGSGLNLPFYSSVVKALQQMKRVLKASGRLLFIEHGRAPDPSVAVWQDRITPVWKRIGGGCHLNRKMDELLATAGFQITELKTCYLPGPRPMNYTYQGFAQWVQQGEA